MKDQTTDIAAEFDQKLKSAQTPQERASVIAAFETAYAAARTPLAGVASPTPQDSAHFTARYQAAQSELERTQVLADLAATAKAGRLREAGE